MMKRKNIIIAICVVIGIVLGIIGYIMLTKDSRNAAKLVERGNSYQCSKESEKAISIYNEAIALNPQMTEAYLQRGWCYLNSKKGNESYEKANADFNKTIEIAGETDSMWSAWAHIGRGVIYEKQKELEKAITMFNMGVKLQPRHPNILSTYAWYLATSQNEKFRDGVKAFHFAMEAVELSHQEDGVLLDNLAAAYAELGRFEEAIATQERAIKQTSSEHLLNEMVLHLAAYKMQKPWREE